MDHLGYSVVTAWTISVTLVMTYDGHVACSLHGCGAPVSPVIGAMASCCIDTRTPPGRAVADIRPRYILVHGWLFGFGFQ